MDDSFSPTWLPRFLFPLSAGIDHELHALLFEQPAGGPHQSEYLRWSFSGCRCLQVQNGAGNVFYLPLLFEPRACPAQCVEFRRLCPPEKSSPDIPGKNDLILAVAVNIESENSSPDLHLQISLVGVRHRQHHRRLAPLIPFLALPDNGPL